MAKKVQAMVKLQIPAGKATPAPPVGTALGPQFASLEHPPHVVVGTPGRLLKHLNKGSLDLRHIKSLVLDEADRMFDMGSLRSPTQADD